jgi:ferrous iron transport protein B
MKKVVTIVLAVAIILFAMLQFPGLSEEKTAYYKNKSTLALEKFDTKVKNTRYYEEVDSKIEVFALLNYYDEYRSKRMIATSKESAFNIDKKYQKINKSFYKFIKPKKDKEARKINKVMRKLTKDRKRILRNIKNDKVENSLLGMTGRAMEPITQYAGFDWKINVAFLSSFAARESAVATLGSLYENNQANNVRAEESMALNSGYTSVHAVAIIIFMLLTPPCIATMIVVKMQTGKYRWMMFAIFFPVILGISIASLVFSLGMANGWSGLETMTYFYVVVVSIVLILGLFPSKSINWKGGLNIPSKIK